MAGLNAVWSSAERLPTGAEIREPAAAGWSGPTRRAPSGLSPVRAARRDADGPRGRGDPRRGARGARRSAAPATWCWSRSAAAPTRWRWRPHWPRRRRSSGCEPARSPSTTACRTARGARGGRSPPRARSSAWTRSRSRRVGGRVADGGPEAAARDARYDALDDAADRARRRRDRCSATPSTTRPRPCCSAWLAAPVRDRWPECRAPRRSDRPAAARASPRDRRWRPARRSGSRRRGTTRTTPTPPSPASRVRASALPAARGERSARACPRRWPAPRRCCAPTPTLSTPGPHRSTDPARRRRAGGASGRGPHPGAAPRGDRGGRPGGRVDAPITSHEIDRLVTDWRGQGAVSLPGGLVAHRAYDRLSFQ